MNWAGPENIQYVSLFSFTFTNCSFFHHNVIHWFNYFTEEGNLICMALLPDEIFHQNIQYAHPQRRSKSRFLKWPQECHQGLVFGSVHRARSPHLSLKDHLKRPQKFTHRSTQLAPSSQFVRWGVAAWYKGNYQRTRACRGLQCPLVGLNGKQEKWQSELCWMDPLSFCYVTSPPSTPPPADEMCFGIT